MVGGKRKGVGEVPVRAKPSRFRLGDGAAPAAPCQHGRRPTPLMDATFILPMQTKLGIRPVAPFSVAAFPS